MLFNFGVKSATLLIFFIHGLLFAILLLGKGVRDEQKSSSWLAAFILLCSLYIAPFMCGYAGWYSKQPYREILFFTPFQQLFLMPPILYFYIKSLLNPSFVFQKKDWLHLLPAILYLLYALVMWLTDTMVLDEYFFYADERDRDLDLWYQIAGFLMMAYYLLRCLRLYARYRRNTYQMVSFAESILFSWVQRFLIVFLLLLLIRILFFALNPEWANFGAKYWYYLSFSILFYFISWTGYVHAVKTSMPFRYAFDVNQSAERLSPVVSPEASPIEEVSTKDESASDYDKDLKEKIEDLMQAEKLFTNPRLTLFDVAQTVDSHPKKVSNVINKGFQMNFNDFVNRYRVQEVIRRIESKEDQIKTLLGIALDSGFNSKSTFNRAFKKHTNRTPKDYFQEKKA